jgi:segregation and condensation protein B
LHHTADAVQVSGISDQPLPFPLPVMVESLLFVASEPVPVTQIAEALEVKVAEVEQALTELNAEIVARGIRVQRKGDKVQLTTQPECAPYVEKFLGLDLTTRLSKPALETLAIIAYQQPVTRAKIEHVRGVNCDAVLATLLNRGLIEELGRLETAGRPIQYGTTFAFLQHFGLRGLEDMPSLQPEEAAALESLAEQGQVIAVDQAVPANRPAGEGATETPAGVSPPDQSPAPIETQLTWMSDETPPLNHVDAVVEQVSAEQVDAIAELETQNVESPEADRMVEAPTAVDLAPDQFGELIEPQSAAEDFPNETAVL